MDPKFALTQRARLVFRDSSLLHEAFEQGRRPQEIAGYSEETMALLYKRARSLFEAERYEDGVDAFLFLATLNSAVGEYWLGLGMSLQMCGEEERAIDAYELAAACNLESPVPYFYLAKCLFALHDKENALHALQLALEYAEGREEYEELKEQAFAVMRKLAEESE